MLSALVADCAGVPESVACTVKLEAPDAVGVPEIVPLLLLRVRPEGREPEMIDQVYGIFPPLAARVVE
jgi:hypothetical protein